MNIYLECWLNGHLFWRDRMQSMPEAVRLCKLWANYNLPGHAFLITSSGI